MGGEARLIAAKTRFEALLSIDPENVRLHGDMAEVLLKTGEFDGARMHFSEALRLNPTNQDYQVGLSEAARRRNPVYRFFATLDWEFWSLPIAMVIGLVGSVVHSYFDARGQDAPPSDRDVAKPSSTMATPARRPGLFSPDILDQLALRFIERASRCRQTGQKLQLASEYELECRNWLAAQNSEGPFAAVFYNEDRTHSYTLTDVQLEEFVNSRPSGIGKTP